MTDAKREPKAALVTTLKNEGPYIWEWVAHHRNCGFDPIFVFQNDSLDASQEILRELEAIGAIHYFDNPAQRDWQTRAYRRASKHEEFQKADYFMGIDLDEFLVVHVGERRVQDLIAAAPAFDCMYINWRIFGHNYKEIYEPGLITEQFERTHEKSQTSASGDKAMLGFKSLIKAGSWVRPGFHAPKEPLRPEDEMHIVNGSGLKAGEFQRKGWRVDDPGAYRLAQINHYPLKDMQSFVLKSTRGGGCNPDRKLGLEYWQKNDFLDCHEGFEPKYHEALKAEMQRLDAASGNRLSYLTRGSQEIRRLQIEERFEHEDAKELLEEIKAALKTRVI